MGQRHNRKPSAEDLADVAIQSAESARAFGIEPRVAMISFSTGTPVLAQTCEGGRSYRIVRLRAPGLAVDGPMQYDAAAIASVGQAKRPGSPVAGRATVFISPTWTPAIRRTRRSSAALRSSASARCCKAWPSR